VEGMTDKLVELVHLLLASRSHLLSEFSCVLVITKFTTSYRMASGASVGVATGFAARYREGNLVG
jgi:hypothetical protein